MTPLHRNQSKKRTMHSIFLIWVIAMVLALPNTVLFQFKYIKDNALGIKPFCTAYDPSVTISVLEDLNLVHTSTKEGRICSNLQNVLKLCIWNIVGSSPSVSTFFPISEFSYFIIRFLNHIFLSLKILYSIWRGFICH